MNRTIEAVIWVWFPPFQWLTGWGWLRIVHAAGEVVSSIAGAFD